MTPVEAGLLALLGAALFLDQWPALQSMAARPIVAGPLVGWVLGAPAEGALWGAVFEAVFLGVLPVGATRYPDAAAAAIAGTTLALAGREGGLYPAGLAIAAAAAAGRLGEIVMDRQRRWNARTASRARERVAGGDLAAPGRATALALARGAALGAGQTLLAVGAGLLALELLGGSPWSAPLPARALAVAALAAAAVAGVRRFGPDRAADEATAGSTRGRSWRARAATIVAGAVAGAAIMGWGA
jgi:PTS system mannose-specific IIC component